MFLHFIKTAPTQWACVSDLLICALDIVSPTSGVLCFYFSLNYNSEIILMVCHFVALFLVTGSILGSSRVTCVVLVFYVFFFFFWVGFVCCLNEHYPFQLGFGMINFAYLFYYLVYFYYYLWNSLHFLILFKGSTILLSEINFQF